MRIETAQRAVLVVDDEAVVRDVLELALRCVDLTVWPAASGQQAVWVFTDHREEIGAALLDVEMSGWDGIQTAAALRALDGDLPICFMPGDLESLETPALEAISATQIFRKPFHLAEVASYLKAIVSGGSQSIPLAEAESTEERVPQQR